MPVGDLYNNLKVLPGIPPATVTNADTAFVSAILDTQDYEDVLFVFSTGALTDTDVTSTFLLEESDAANMSGSNAVADADLFGTEAGCSPAAANDDTAYKIGYRGTKRYIRATLTPSGNNSGNFVVGGVWVVSGRKKPYATQADAT